MVSSNRLAEVAAAIGDPARAAMLSALMDMRALTASELSLLAGITPQTASSHLAKLTSVGLVAMERQGRHHYHRLASANVASMLEGMLLHAADHSAKKKTVRTGPRDEAMRLARTCYDHIAGRLAVAITDAMVARKLIEVSQDAAVITERGQHFLAANEILDIDGGSRRPICRACLDWSERRHHLGGRVGAAICSRAIDKSWVRRAAGTRALTITPKGTAAFKDLFGVRLD